jgi:hypothetical protein
MSAEVKFAAIARAACQHSVEQISTEIECELEAFVKSVAVQVRNRTK